MWIRSNALYNKTKQKIKYENELYKAKSKQFDLLKIKYENEL